MLATGCFSTGEGLSPPAESIYFPVGLALDQVEGSARHLVVVNSDYDLQYNAGTLQILDLEGVRRLVPRPCSSDQQCLAGDERCDGASGFCVATAGPTAGRPCGDVGERSVRDQGLHPGLCEAFDPVQRGVITTAVQIGAFATDVIYRPRPEGDGRGRIFFPVRGDATLHWADLDPSGNVECGQSRNGGVCDDTHRVGDDPDQENTRDLRLAPEPFAIDAAADGSVVLVTHQTGDNVALFENDWSSPSGPALKFDLNQLGRRPVGVAAIPKPGIVLERENALPPDRSYMPGFLVSFRSSGQVNLVRYLDDAASNPERPYAFNAGASPILLNSLGTDSRGIAVDDSLRRRAELACDEQGLGGAERTECLERAAGNGLDVYVASRSPESLLIGRTIPAVSSTFSSDLPSFYDNLPLPLGPSRVIVGDVIVGGEAGNLSLGRRVFVVCFDSRRIVVYDPRERRVEVEIETGRGPHALAVDAENGHLFVGHFTDSYIGVVSVDRRFPRTYGKMIATIGTPKPPRASK